LLNRGKCSDQLWESAYERLGDILAESESFQQVDAGDYPPFEGVWDLKFIAHFYG